MTPASEWADRFHDWYDTEHIPVRMRVPGFTGAQRYGAVEGGGFLAVYDMENPGVLDTPAYLQVKKNPSERTRWMLEHVTGFTRYTCEEIARQQRDGGTGLASPVLYAVFFEVPQDRLQAFDDWYEQDHVPILMRCPGWQMVRRFGIVSGEPERYNRLALHYLSSVADLDSEARQEARRSPWRARLAQEPWFKGKYLVFHRHGPRQAAS
ncbi:MAG: hypothetical protein AB7L76_01115 [Burkholderiaceae bacterium]